MALLEQIQQMRNQGISDEDIVNRLYEQGISPKEINDAINQSRIKRAVIGQDNFNPAGENPPSPSQYEETYAPQTQEYSAPAPQETYTEQQNYSQPQQYYQQDTYGYPQATDSDTIIDIAEQVFSEKIKEIQKQTDKTTEFKTLAETKIENISERLKRIESIIDKLQISILDKIGTYGENINSIKKEMSMMQDSFGKVVNQAVKGAKVSLSKTKKKAK